MRMIFPCIYDPKTKLYFLMCLLQISSKNGLKEQKILWLVAETVLEKEFNKFIHAQSHDIKTHSSICVSLTRTTAGPSSAFESLV